MILITGASGSVGRSVLKEILKTKQPVRAMYRSPDDAAKVPANVPSAIADFADKTSLLRALEGVDRVYLVCSPIRELVELESTMIDACKESAVRHVILNSALGAADYPKSFPSWHRKVEDKLRASSLGYTILRPNSFMQNILAYYAGSIKAQGAFYAAMGNAKTSLIDVRDVGAAAASLLSSQPAGKTYELNGPEALTYAEVAEKLSRAIGRTIRYIDISVDQQKQGMLGQGMPDWLVTALLDLQVYYTGGQGGELDDVLAKLLGRAPRTTDQFAVEFADSFGVA